MDDETPYVFNPTEFSCVVADDWYDITRRDFTQSWSTLPECLLYSSVELNDIRLRTVQMLQTFYLLLSLVPEQCAYHERTFSLVRAVIERDHSITERLKLQSAYHDYLRNEVMARQEHCDRITTRLNTIEEKLDILLKNQVVKTGSV